MEYAECKMCLNGVLLPFTGPEGHMVYFCSSCRARFSGYQEEPIFEGAPIFAEMAYYSFRDAMDTGDTFTKGELLDSYRTILEENPPTSSESSVPDCDLCSRDLLINCENTDLCWLPSV
jgi:hypothetical protein